MNYKHLEAELLVLKHELHQLRIANQDLTSKNCQQTEIIAKLTAENQSLKKELIKLQDKLNINYSNSGLPSSKDVYRIEKKSKPRSGRKGSQEDNQVINIKAMSLKFQTK